MRLFLMPLLLIFGLALAAPALAEEKSVKDLMGPPPKSDLRTYRTGREPKKKDDGMGIQGMALIAGLAGLTFLGLVVWYRKETREMGIPEDEAALAAQGASGGSTVGLSPKETVFAAISRAGGWVTPGRISMSSGLDSGNVEGHLESLVREGRVKAGRDKQGRVLYRAV